RRLIVESVHMTDWDVFIESFPNGRHTFPRFGRPREGPPPAGPKRFTTTMRYLRAERGRFSYVDHGTPWSTIAPNMTVTITRGRDDYRGRASFSQGTVQIQSYEPMAAAMTSRFKIDGKLIHFDHVGLTTDGSRSVLTGDVDTGRWPEQVYQIRSRIQFPRMREIFFARDAFSLSGEGDFTGTFHLFKGGRELKGRFSSGLAGVNAYRFPNLRGSVVWLPRRLDVTDAQSDLFGGTAQFGYSMAAPPEGGRWHAAFDAAYEQVDLATYTTFLETDGIRVAGRATGRNRLSWPLGRLPELRGNGEVTVEPPPGVAVLGRALPLQAIAEREALGPGAGPFNRRLPLGHVPIGGRIVYALDPEWITLTSGWVGDAQRVRAAAHRRRIHRRRHARVGRALGGRARAGRDRERICRRHRRRDR
ncbi:MAG: hypothetical protein LC804_27345, partial [Acidobacteria bacterium]|nr:hypothetical protein [Acidobacteriota bacterium]